MRFSTRKGHCEKQSKTLIGSKCSVCRGWSYFLVGACGPGNTTKIGVFSDLRTHGREQRMSKKKARGPELTCALFLTLRFFSKNLTENSGVFFQERLKLVRGCFLASSGYDWFMRPKPLKNRHFGCTEGLHKTGQIQRAGRS